jgi:RimJ/RimL family protein N-acetyltransferase
MLNKCVTFKFRPLASDDFPLLFAWLSRPHVREWWDTGEDTLEVVAQNYGEEEEGLARFILLEIIDGRETPIGYFQHYAASDGSIGIDQFIGEEDYINKGIGQQAIRLFLEMIVREHKPASIILDPQPENKRAIRCYEKVGFRHYETRLDENGVLAYMMRLDCRDLCGKISGDEKNNA